MNHGESEGFTSDSNKIPDLVRRQMEGDGINSTQMLNFVEGLPIGSRSIVHPDQLPSQEQSFVQQQSRHAAEFLPPPPPPEAQNLEIDNE